MLALLTLSGTVGAQPSPARQIAPLDGGSVTLRYVTPETYAERRSRESKTKSLAGKIEKILNQPGVSHAFWGIDVVSLDSGTTLYEQNADKLFTPASNAKLFTTTAALALLGPDYRYRTTIESAVTIDAQGRLQGDLILVGRGDPNLSGRVLPYLERTERKTPHLQLLEDLADQVVRRGLKQIDGNIIGDDSYFIFERYPEGWTQDDLMWEYGAGVSALAVNDNVVFLNIFPGASVGVKAKLQFDPDVPYYEINNLTVTTAAGSGPRKIAIDRQPGARIITVWGTIPVDDVGFNEALAIEDPAQFAAQAVRAMLERRGVKVAGREMARHAYPSDVPASQAQTATQIPETVRPTTDAPGGGVKAGPDLTMGAPTGRQVLAFHDSTPILDDLTVINKVSQNLHAEITLRVLGREKGVAPTLRASLDVIKGVLTEAGIDPDDYSFQDGSGLSREDLVTPRAIVKLLQFADAHSATWGSALRRTLPVAGVDGSLSERFRGTAAQGRVLGKTGSISNVNALSGYAETLSGERLAFSIVCNHHKLTSRGAVRYIDQIVQAIVEDASAKLNRYAREKSATNQE